MPFVREQSGGTALNGATFSVGGYGDYSYSAASLSEKIFENIQTITVTKTVTYGSGEASIGGVSITTSPMTIAVSSLTFTSGKCSVSTTGSLVNFTLNE